MRRIVGIFALFIATTVVGCNTTNSLFAKKQAPPTNVAGSNGTTAVGGTWDLSESSKLKDPVKIHLAYGAWHEQSGNLQQAHESYAKVLEKRPKEIEAMLGMARIDRAYGREEEADAQLKKTLKAHPKNPKVYLAIGQVHASKSEWVEALEKMEVAHKLAPYDKIYEYHLAVVEAKSGEIPSALEHFARSVGQAEAYFNVGFILNEQGQQAEAQIHLMKALKLKPDLKQAELALAAIRSGKTEEVQPASFSEKE